jgi:hypothetical protein
MGKHGEFRANCVPRWADLIRPTTLDALLDHVELCVG